MGVFRLMTEIFDLGLWLERESLWMREWGELMDDEIVLVMFFMSRK